MWEKIEQGFSFGGNTMRRIRVDERTEKKVVLRPEQIKLAIRNYIRTSVIPPRDAKIDFDFGDMSTETFDDLKQVTITWDDFSCIGE